MPSYRALISLGLSISQSQKLKIEAIRAYAKDPDRPACESCQEDDLVCLTLSHKGPFTQAEVAEAKRRGRPRLGGSTLRGWLKRQGWPHDPEIADLVIECMNCNLKRAGWGDGGWGPGGRRRRKRSG